MTKGLFPSRSNLIFNLADDQYVFINPLSGACDIGDSTDKVALESAVPRFAEDKQEWLSRGYYFESAQAEENYFQERYQDFLTASQTDETQFLLVPTYGCNFNCGYCYQKGLEGTATLMTAELVLAFFKIVTDYRSQHKREVMVSLFGGEPLLASSAQKELINLIVAESVKHEIPLSVVTNAYNLIDYIDILSPANFAKFMLA